LFLLSAVAEHLGGTFDLIYLGGLYRSYPDRWALFLIAAMSLPGLPPLSGFFGKLRMVQAGLALEQYNIVAVVLCVSVLMLFSMMKVWNETFSKPSPGHEAPLTQDVGGDRVCLRHGTVAAHVLGRAAYCSGIPLWLGALSDELRG
jgi:multicomponent Na+:H+ antiporter subunit D